ncbi:sodium-dependent transporter [bacterium]|nr:sodium-dependent transporter [FCB group bacterium]MBL7192010.1 sodium-dependent transporter [bacterium]
MSEREHWGSRTGFILAAAGSAIGLGNIWKFPFITGMYGGAAFVLAYLICIALVGFPVMLIEFAIGRRTQRNPVGAFKALAPGTPWFMVGGLGVVAVFVILSYYSVVAGWTLGYIFAAISGAFHNLAEPSQAKDYFENFGADPFKTIICHLFFMALVSFVVIKGVKKGIEKWSKILMPLLLVILVVLMIRGLTLPGAEDGVNFLVKPDFSKLNGNTILVALGHAFFTLSLGMGAMITYGSYLSRKENLLSSAVIIVFLDTFIALMAGIAIFTAVFAHGLAPDGGPALIFHVLPTVFPHIPGGYFFGILFFLLLFIAAITSGISLLEVVIAYFTDEKGWSRKTAVIVFGGLVFLVGVPSALSTGPLADWKIFFGMTFFDFMDYMSFKYMLPLGGFLMCIFVGYYWGAKEFIDEIKSGNPAFSLRPVAAMVLITIAGILILITLVTGILGVGA